MKAVPESGINPGIKPGGINPQFIKRPRPDSSPCAKPENRLERKKGAFQRIELFPAIRFQAVSVGEIWDKTYTEI
jgi:hypothetical protein